MSSQIGSGEDRATHGQLGLATLPPARTMWMRVLLLIAIAVAAFLLDRLTVVQMDYWLLAQEGYGSVFWTNFRTGSVLFVVGFAAAFPSIWLGGRRKGLDTETRRSFLLCALIFGMIGGYLLARRYLDILPLIGSVPVGEADAVFGRDIGFYMFSLPAYWVLWSAAALAVIAGLVSLLTGSLLAQHSASARDARAAEFFRRIVEIFSQPAMLVYVGLAGLLAAIGLWLARFGLLLKDNRDSAVYVGAEELDVAGVFSTLNHFNVRVILALACTLAVLAFLWRYRNGPDRELRPGRMAAAAGLVLAIEFSFGALLTFKDGISIRPNEPLVQIPHMQRHIDATRRGYGLERIETRELIPAGASDPLPSADELLKSATLKNVPLWPGWVSYLERVVDPQHADRIVRTKGDPLVYGPLLDTLRQQQKLRSYYDFLDVDTVRYEIGGEKRIFVSSVRELPFIDPKPWIAWWAQRMLLFTHSHGMVMAPAHQTVGEGEPNYLTHSIPMQWRTPELRLDNPALYYGEGAGGVMAFTNARHVKEFDYPTKEDRAETVYPQSVESGIRMNSFLKRLVVGWRSGAPLNIWFSDQIGEEARAHFARPPLDRMDRVAPFLYYDSNPFAVINEGRIFWMINAMTTSDQYPYSKFEMLGDKSSEKAREPRPNRRVNYVKDAVKATIDGYTGRVMLYKIADEPIINTWANIYPALFRNGEEMPKGIRSQLQYPRQLMHVQFDNVYYKYHMTDPMTFYHLEDMWDDADEVKGPILADGKSITFSIEPRHWIAETGGLLPAATERNQFVLSMVFTNEQALNLRAIPIVYQDGPDYGRAVVLQVPKGHFYLGPEQADAAIDQSPEISEQISWWNRKGSSVIRGHTSTLVVGNEVIYVEPLFIRSQQNPVAQLKRVIVVFRGFPAAGATLEEALREAVNKAHAAQNRKVARVN